MGADRVNKRFGKAGRLQTVWTASAVTVVVVGLFAVTIGTSQRWVLVGGLVVVVGALAFAVAVVVEIVRRELLKHVNYVNEVVERGVIEVLPPGRVAERLLDRVYGPSPFNQTLLTALLGGEGRIGDGGDLTISEHTEIDLSLDSIDDRTYRLVMEQRYSFRNRVPTSTFVIFATSEGQLRDSIVAGCRRPLFELWYIREDPTDPRFEESVESMRESVLVGMSFADARGVVHHIPTSGPSAHLREVRLRDWGKYLDFFRMGESGEAALDRGRHMNSLRIFEIDLHALAGDHAVDTILDLTIKSTTIQRLADGYCYWQAPYPCFVEKMTFRTSALMLEDHPELYFHVKPFAISSEESPTWRSGIENQELALRRWMLPGHGVALMWRPFKEP